MDARDVALQHSAPVVTVPRYGGFTPLAENGHRFLVTGDGLWLEARRPWLYLRVPLVCQKSVPMPYGWVGREISLSFGKIPRHLVIEFYRFALDRCPEECVGWIVWHAGSGEMRLVFPTEESTGCAHVRYRRPILDEDEHLVVDLHSHGRLSAFFSTQDDRDDRGEFKIAGVIGNCDRGQCSTAFRLCANGLFLPLAFDETGLIGQTGGNDGYPSSCA